MVQIPLFSTGDEAPTGDYICRRFYVPKEFGFITAFDGALALLANPDNWEQSGALTPEESALMAREMLLEGFQQSVCMIGAILPVATSEMPQNMLLCDGSQYLRVDYPKLYESLNSALLVDSDTFVVPDLRDKFIYGAGSNAELSEGGSEQVTLQENQMPTHDHDTNAHRHTLPSHTHTTQSHQHGFPSFETPIEIPTGTGSGVFTWGTPNLTRQTDGAIVTVNSVNQLMTSETVYLQVAGGSAPHDNMPPFIALKYGIIAR